MEIKSKKELIDYINKISQKLSKQAKNLKNNLQELVLKLKEHKLPELKKVRDENQVKKYRIFFVSDMDEEEAFLHEMSIKGMHFKEKKGIRYIFDKGEPSNSFYHLGYYEKDKMDGERYLKNYEEAGWKSVFHEKAEFDGTWHYFRLDLPKNEVAPQIFSDRISRMALYQRLLASWQTLIVMLVVCLLIMSGIFVFTLMNPSNAQRMILVLCLLVILLTAGAVLLYLYIYLKVHAKYQEFTYKYGKRQFE